jgi:hypothetical protein
MLGLWMAPWGGEGGNGLTVLQRCIQMTKSNVEYESV